MATLNWLDYAILAVIILSTLTGILRGFMKELIAICIWALAIWLGYHYAGHLDGYFTGWVDDSRLRYGIGFIIIMVATLIIGGIFNTFLSLILRKSGLSATDRFLGMGFGLLRGTLIVSLLLVVLQMTSLEKKDGMKNSQLAAQFDPVVSMMRQYLPAMIDQIKTFEASHNLGGLNTKQETTESDNTPLLAIQ